MNPYYEIGDGTTPYVTRALNGLLATEGVQAPSSRAIAAGARMGVSTLSEFYTDRAQMVARCGRRSAELVLWHLKEAAALVGWEGVIPVEEEDLTAERWWLGWRALSIGNPDVAAAVAGAHREEVRQFATLLRDTLAAMLDRPVPEERLVEVAEEGACLRRVLAERLAIGDERLTAGEAQARLLRWKDRAVAALVQDATTPADPATS